jgi:uncharacterized protein YbjT (DUF2867 family)
MIVITAPTGNIGRRLLSLLVEAAPARGEELRVVVRDPARLPEAVRGRVEVVTGSHGDAATVERAFTGADAAFWLVPPDASATPDEAYSGFTRPAASATSSASRRSAAAPRTPPRPGWSPPPWPWTT